MKKLIYLDYAAATPVDPRVLKAMQPYFSTLFANPSGLHEAAQEAREAVEEARYIVAKIIKVLPEEIIFTSGGTESINLALKGVALRKGKGHLITSQIEHPAVLETCAYLERKGFSVTYLAVDKSGLVDPEELVKAIRKDTFLVSIMYANNEIGTIEPIKEIAIVARKKGILFHTDACQAGLLSLDTEELGVDFLTLNGSKIYGPKGTGILYKRKGIILEPLLHGGEQEAGLRSGTENVAGIVGFAKALELAQNDNHKEGKRLRQLQKYLLSSLLEFPEVRLNGHSTLRVPQNVSVSFAGIEGETLLRALSAKGIYVSTGSACSAGSIEVSYVLTAIGLPEKYARGTVRISMGKGTREKELEYVVKVLKEVVGDLRKVS